MRPSCEAPRIAASRSPRPMRSRPSRAAAFAPASRAGRFSSAAAAFSPSRASPRTASLPRGEELAREGKTPIFVAVDGEPAGLVAVADVVRDESREAVERLHSLGLEVAMLTGDNRRTAEAIAAEARHRPRRGGGPARGQANEVKRLQAEGKRVGHGRRRHQRRPALSRRPT